VKRSLIRGLIVGMLMVIIAPGEQTPWSAGTAYALPTGRWELGLFQPLRYGLSPKVELSTYKLTTLLMPTVIVKLAREEWRGWDRALRFTLSYPTPLMRKLQSPLGMKLGGPDKFALISPEFEIPSMLLVSSELFLTRNSAFRSLLTTKAGATFALGSNGLDDRTSIDLPLIYHRLGVLYSKVGFRLGIDLLCSLTSHWSVLLGGDLFLLPGLPGDLALEHKGLLLRSKGKRFKFSLGYKLVVAKYPDGYPNKSRVQWHLFPLLDMIWTW
jgi:hypothetical protein